MESNSEIYRLKDGIFLRYRHGNLLFIDTDIKKKIKSLIPKLEKEQDHTKLLRLEIKDIADGSGAGIHPSSTWLQTFRELIDRYERYDSNPVPPATKAALIKILKLLTKPKNTETFDWDKLRKFIIDNLDNLAPTYAERFDTFDGKQIKRSKDGEYYYENDDGSKTIVSGLKTPAEEKLAFYTNDIQMQFGRLYYLLRFIALFDIAFEYKNNKKYFAEKVSCVLYDNEGDTSYLNWEWNIPTPFEYVPFKWHPRSPLSNPEWLGSDLIMHLPFINGEPGQTIVPIAPERGTLQKWQDAFKDYAWQVELPILSNVLIGEEAELYFDFLDRKVRWINGNAFTQPILVVPSNDNNGIDAIEIARKFLSVLNMEHEVQLSERLISVQQKRYLPWFKDLRMPTFLLVNPEYAIPHGKINYSPNRWTALAFMREAVNSLSIHYEFLNYYKVIELAFDGKTSELIKWVNANVDDICNKKGLDWYKVNIGNSGKNAGAYLHSQGRTAIAHATYTHNRKGNVHNPDSPEDYQRVSTDLVVMRELAKEILTTIK